jgi:hypothetical protein
MGSLFVFLLRVAVRRSRIRAGFDWLPVHASGAPSPQPPSPAAQGGET